MSNKFKHIVENQEARARLLAASDELVRDLDDGEMEAVSGGATISSVFTQSLRDALQLKITKTLTPQILRSSTVVITIVN